ncbi:hypothetical protein SAMN05444144_109172 [Flavobacterium akiainvivens]|nr:hypothetical protein SAMN05444144_109172 [Flavobacterium akiainvivens]
MLFCIFNLKSPAVKTTLPLLCLAMLFIACRQNTPVNQTPALAPGHTDSAGISPQQKKINDSLAQLQDSLAIEKMLVKAIGMAKTYRQTEFSFSFHDTLTDNMKAYTDVTGGRWFSKNKRYVKIKREASSIVYTDIFEVQGLKLVQVLHNGVPGQTHVNDTVMDINGDGHKDFAVHWYPSSGCCARDRYDVYIFNPKTGAFADKQEFINPTF